MSEKGEAPSLRGPHSEGPQEEEGRTREDRDTFEHERIYWLNDDPGDPSNGHTKRNSVTNVEAGFLAALAENRHVLEIGTGTGYSARCMARLAASVTTVDIQPFIWKTVFPGLREIGIACLDNKPLADNFDMIFIDGDHSPKGVERDLSYAQHRLTPGGFIVVHDLHLGSTGPAIRAWAEKNGWEVTPFRTRQGLGRLDPK